ncbi:MAG: DUF547 domain-containing protein [Planctomycetota bacterium]|nr:MAG: DUF547 domain-containing protein [Planctomycetota bacterium]
MKRISPPRRPHDMPRPIPRRTVRTTTHIHRLPRFLLAWLALCCLPRFADASGDWYVGRRVSPSQLVPLDRIDHSLWDALLQKYVDRDGFVDYRRWKATAADRQALDRYLAILSTGNPDQRTTRQAKLAFWINAYNALTIRGILREYPTTSIRNHTARLFGYNIWKNLHLYVGGKPYHLEQIEHQILRPMRDPRIHFAIVCASRGCPRLLNRAYVPEKVDEQLDANARDFFSRPQNFRFDPAANRFYLSSILSWFAEDFGSDTAAQLRRIAPYLPTEAARQAALRGNVSISYLDYDWSLNDQSTRRTARR